MRNYSTTGFLTDSGRTIKFTIALDKPVVNAFISFSLLNIQVRKYDSLAPILNEDVIDNSNLTVLTQVQSLGIEVTITKSDMFVEANNIPLSIFIEEADAEFYNNDDETEKYEVTQALNYVKSIKSSKDGTYELPSNFDVTLCNCYQIVSGEFVLDSSKATTVTTNDTNHRTILQDKKNLADTDYIMARTFEDLLNNPPTSYANFMHFLQNTANTYATELANRGQWRQEIEDLENIS